MLFCGNLLAALVSGKSNDLAAGNELAVDVVGLGDAFESLVDDPSRSAEFRRIMIVLVLGNFRLCSRRISSLYILQGFVFLIALCVKLKRGGTGGGDTSVCSRGGRAGALGSCCTVSVSCLSRRLGGNGGGGT